MDLERRITELCRADEDEMAKHLLKEIVLSKTDVEIELQSESIEIVHEQFTGSHAVRRDADGQKRVVNDGEYRVECAGRTFTLATRTINEQVKQDAEAKLNAGEQESVDANEQRSVVRRLQTVAKQASF